MISLDTGSGRLDGTLLQPEGVMRPPVVLLIAGSGPTDRDGNSTLLAGRTDSLKLLAQALAEVGLASVRYDKRGVAGSAAAGGPESALRFETFTDDAACWIDALTREDRFSAVAVIGHSEGSLIGMLAASSRPVAAFVSIAGAAQRASEILRTQLRDKLPASLATANETLLQSLENDRLVETVPAELSALYRASVQPYLISWMKHVPTEAFAAIDAPALVIQGDCDLQVDVGQAQVLHQARPASQLTIIGGMNHVLKTVGNDPARQAASYGDPSLPIDPDFVATVQAFLLGVFQARSKIAAMP